MQRIIVVPGVAVSAMLVANVDTYDWLKKQTEKSWKEMRKEMGKYDPIQQNLSSIKIAPHDLVAPRDSRPLKSDSFGGFARFFILSFNLHRESLNEHENRAVEELMIQELLFRINRKVFGLVNSITPRELEVLQKKIVEGKSITKVASEMGIKPQGVVARMATIRKKVQENLMTDEV